MTQTIYDGLIIDPLQEYLDTSSKALLAQACVTFSLLFKKDLDREAFILGQHVICGREHQAEQMLLHNPALLCKKIKVKDYSGQVIIGTAFQLALGAEDYLMAEMMLPYFKKLEKNYQSKDKGLALKQLQNQFPDGLQAQQTYFNFDNIPKTFINGTGDEIDEALKKFSRRFKPRQTAIEQGKHFEMRNLYNAYQAYIENYQRLKDKGVEDVFFHKVIGVIQARMPANYAQIHCAGIKRVLDFGGVFNRSFKLESGGVFFPLSENPGLGQNKALLSMVNCGRLCHGWAGIGGHQITLNRLIKYKDEQFNKLVMTLEQQLARQQGCCCNIM